MKRGRHIEPPEVTLNTPEIQATERSLRFTVTLRCSDLRPYPRSIQQMDLLRRVVYLREVKEMPYDAIAKLLASKGMKSPRGNLLSAEMLFSIYKKRPASFPKPV